MEVKLNEGERIDDLERNGLKIIQNKKGFCFGIDAVLLSGFAKAYEGEKVLDLGTGTGIIPILMSAKTKASKLSALEIQPVSFDMAKRSVSLNDLENKIEIINGDIKEASAIFGRASFDVVTSNPPYIKANSGIVNPKEGKAIARHEVLLTFEDLAKQAKQVLKPQGRFYLVHRPQRLAEIIKTLKDNRLEPKRIKFVHSYIDSDATLFLLEAVSGGREEMKVEKPLIIYKEENVYSDEIHEIYGF